MIPSNMQPPAPPSQDVVAVAITNDFRLSWNTICRDFDRITRIETREPRRCNRCEDVPFFNNVVAARSWMYRNKDEYCHIPMDLATELNDGLWPTFEVQH